MTRAPIIVSVIVLVLSCATACSPTAGAPIRSSEEFQSTPPSVVPPDAANAYPFSKDTFWRSTLDKAPLEGRSEQMIDYLVSSITDRYNGVAAFNAHQYNSPLYTVGPNTPRVDVRFDDCQKKGYVPDGLTGPGGQFSSVPMPARAAPAKGTDREVSIWSPSTDQLWEFWVTKKSADGIWSACWGGRLDDVSKSDGRFPSIFGATATGLPNAGGIVRYNEIRRGRIDHAISIVIPNPAVATRFSWPARRSDGVDTNVDAIPEGSRLRLDPAVDVDALDLTPAGAMIARAAQQYGFVVVDRGGSVSVLAEQVASVNGTDPWEEILAGPDYTVLKNFPWVHMQVVKENYGRPVS